MDQIINLFERKGWALYKVTEDTNGNLEKIVLNGKVNHVEPDNYYHILPMAFKSDDISEIIDHIEIAQKTKQQPKYMRGGEQTFILDGIEFKTDFIYLHPSHTTDFYVKVNYNNIESTIQYGISNYNTYFFESIDKLIKVVGIPPQQNPVLPKQLRWERTQKDTQI